MYKIGVIGIILYAALAAAAVVKIDVTAQADGSTFYTANEFDDPYAAFGDKVIYFSQTDPSNDSSIVAVISQIDGNGRFSDVVRVPVASRTIGAFTNGNWWGVLVGLSPIMWKLDASNKVIDRTTFDIVGTTHYLKMLSDNTLVAQVNNTVLTFTDESGSWEPSSTIIPYPSYNVGGVYANNNTLVTVNSTGTIMIYTRTTGDYTFSESLSTNLTVSNAPTYVYHNGLDTVLICHAVTPVQDGLGMLEIFTKVGNEWNHQILLHSDLGLTAISYVGYGSTAVIDKDNFLIGAAYDGYLGGVKRGDVVLKYGSALLMQRQPDNTWKRTANFTTQGDGLFASSVFAVDNYFAFVTCAAGDPSPCQFYTSPSCILQPINATCDDGVLQACDANVNVTSLKPYTVYPGCGGFEVTASVTEVSNQSSSYTVSLMFESALSMPYSCDATLSCPGPGAQTTPGSKTPARVSAAFAMSVFSVSIIVAIVALAF